MSAFNEIDDGGSAFPQPLAFNPNGEAVTPGMYFPDISGMSLRDWLAGQALKHIGSEYFASGDVGSFARCHAMQLAEHAYNIADAMLAARKGGAE